MAGYWVRHRLALTIILCISIALIVGLLFVFPVILDRAGNYTRQSIYRNSSIDFVVPEPSYDQIAELPGSHGIEAIYPFYLTKAAVNVNGKTRTTTILVGSRQSNVELTMYNQSRLIRKSAEEYDNPILVDWHFCQETAADIGSEVSFVIGGSPETFRIYGIYETNTLYDGGAILACVPNDLMDAIRQQSSSNGYSGMYVTSSDYNACRQFLTTEYRPLGRLRSREQFDDEAQYQIHYNAITSSAYANEITDFRVREAGLDAAVSTLRIWLGAALAMMVLVVFNILMARRGCESSYFTKHCIPKGERVAPYYTISFCVETGFSIAVYAIVVYVAYKSSQAFIPRSVTDGSLAIFPIAVIIGEIICLTLNSRVYRSVEKNRSDDSSNQTHTEDLDDERNQGQTD